MAKAKIIGYEVLFHKKSGLKALFTPASSKVFKTKKEALAFAKKNKAISIAKLTSKSIRKRKR